MRGRVPRSTGCTTGPSRGRPISGKKPWRRVPRNDVAWLVPRRIRSGASSKHPSPTHSRRTTATVVRGDSIRRFVVPNLDADVDDDGNLVYSMVACVHNPLFERTSTMAFTTSLRALILNVLETRIPSGELPCSYHYCFINRSMIICSEDTAITILRIPSSSSTKVRSEL